MTMMFYSKVSLLNKSIHKDISIEKINDFSFAKDTNSIPLLAVEFGKAAKEYPIIFVKNKDQVFSAALLGLRDNENMFLKKGENSGAWDADYLPAYIRRYPFVPVSREEGKELTVGIDENYTGLNCTNKGERLFTEDGEPGNSLKQVIAFLKEYQDQHQLTTAFCKTLNTLDLLEPMAVNAELDSGEKFGLTGFFTIDRKKFAALNSDQLDELFRNGYLELIFAHLISMDNFEKLMAKIHVD